MADNQQASADFGGKRDAYLKITVTGSDGAKPESKVMEPLVITIPATLSVRVASMHVAEIVSKMLKDQGWKTALKAIGLK